MAKREVQAYSWSKEVLKEIRARGGTNASQTVEGLVWAGLQSVGAGSPLLRYAKVQHASSFHEKTYRITLGPSMVFPNRKVALELDDEAHGAPFSVSHEADVPQGADWLPGSHYIAPASCVGCRSLLGAYPRRSVP